MRKLVLIDGMAAVYRGYYAMSRSPRVNSKGFNTSAALGFSMGLYDIIRTQHPTHIGVAFDLPAPTFRHQMYAEYKAHRDPMPEEIQSNLPWIRQIIDAFRIPQLSCPGFEADDVIGTISHQAELAGFDQVLMITPDKDFAQLVTPHVNMYRYGRGGRADTIMGPAEIAEHFGVTQCTQVIDLLGLWGDSIDNIPGIRGIGEKTAKKLIAQFGSIENMVANAAEIKNDKLRAMVQQHADDALFSKQLATIRLDAPIAFDEEALRLDTPDYAQLRQIFDELEFRQLSKRIFTDLSVTNPEAAVQWSSNATAPTVATKPTKQAPTTEPTLFDSTTATTAEAQHVEHSALSATVVNALLGKSIAIAIEGGEVAIASSADSVWTMPFNATNAPSIAPLLAHADTLKLCYNLKELKNALQPMGCDVAGNVFDVQLVHYLLDAEMRHTIDYICSGMIGIVPSDAASQASALWQLYPIMAARLRDAQMEYLYRDVELPLVNVLVGMEHEGVRIDASALQDYAQQLNAERADIEQQIYTLAGRQFNIASPRQLGEVLYDELRITDRPPRTATKQYSTAEEALQRLTDKHAIVPLILEYRSLAKLVGTYLESLPKLISPTDNRLHTVYNQTVTATGRLSSSNPNLQNIPIRTERGREIRRAFVARDADHLLLAADYSQIELRIIASLAQDQHMLQAFNAGHDIHAATAARIYGLPIDEVSKEQRRNAKSVNFGIVYGISAFGLSEQIGISRKEAAALIDEYFAQYPDIQRFIEQCKQFAREHGYARTLMGRRRYLPDINSRNAAARAFAERNAVNMPIQGTSADMIKLAMVNIDQQLRTNHLSTRMILQVHDELVFDLYRPEEEAVRQLVRTAMQEALPLDGIEAEVSIDVGQNWLEAH